MTDQPDTNANGATPTPSDSFESHIRHIDAIRKAVSSCPEPLDVAPMPYPAESRESLEADAKKEFTAFAAQCAGKLVGEAVFNIDLAKANDIENFMLAVELIAKQLAEAMTTRKFSAAILLADLQDAA